jgi:D-glycero-D-manno-heptose 1,7-bisphosphate phosphatase
MKNRAVIMDRDGTLFRDSHYLSDPSKIEIYQGVMPALRKLKKHGWKLLIGTNQSGIGRGYFPESTVNKIHKKFLSLAAKSSVSIDGIFLCPHRPDEKCRCRKPKPGMLRDAERKFNLDLKRCVVIGDKQCDVDWGRAAGARSILVLTGYGRKASARTRRRASAVSKSLAHAADWIIKHEL